MTTAPGRLLLLDSASLYYRAFYAIPETVQAPDGTPINAIRGFLQMLTHLITTHQPQVLLACWDDDWRPAFRVSALPSYKEHRVDESTGEEQTPPSLTLQVPVIAEILRAIGLGPIGHPGFEADDVIATLAERAANSGTRADIVSGDRDLFQLVDDARNIRVLYVGKNGVKEPDIVNQDFLQDHFAIPDGKSYVDFAILRGDPSDGLPGVGGIGSKTAAKLLARFTDLPGILHALESRDRGLTPAQQGRLTAARDYLRAAPTVVNVVRDIPLPEQPGQLPTAPAQPEALTELTQRWGLGNPMNRLTQALGWSTIS